MRPLLALLAALAAATSACATEGLRRFPLREPMWRDDDLDSRSVACRADPKKPGRQVCRPGVYHSYYNVDIADNAVFQPLVRFLAVDPPGESVNVNAFDETPDSAWFVNRIGRRRLGHDEIARGACDGVTLDPAAAADGSWVIDAGKDAGDVPGFRVKLPDGTHYLLKADLRKEAPERETAADVIAGRLYWAAGFNTACDQVVYLRRAVLKLTPGLTSQDNAGDQHAFDEKALDEILAAAAQRGQLYRFSASRWVDGVALGPYTYRGLRDDDPGDAIPHEDRRDLRGARVLAAWTDHYDSREENSLDVWRADGKDPDSSPGHVVHYVIDLGDCLGASWPAEIWPRLGRGYFLDLRDILTDFVTFGLIERSWDDVRLPPGSIFGYYQADHFDPEAWRGAYPNPAFKRMRERDGAWAARIVARFTDDDLAAAVSAGDLSDGGEALFLTQQLAGRRDAILRRWFRELSPLADPVVTGDELCLTDLARASAAFAKTRFVYHAEHDGRALATYVAAAGRVCVGLPRGAPGGYLVVEIANGQAAKPLRAHLYDLGPARGFRLVGLER